jgi:hypothetical protein
MAYSRSSLETIQALGFSTDNSLRFSSSSGNVLCARIMRGSASKPNLWTFGMTEEFEGLFRNSAKDVDKIGVSAHF